ncbi:MAG: response regulator transcription factor [Mariprofundaceae bacterium]
MHILLIDDDTELTELLQRFLVQDGFRVACAADGASGLESIRHGDFDLAVVDVMMPQKSGMDVLRELRTFSQLPIIMLTARGEEMDRIIGLELGADDYVAKPCNPRELAARIRAVLRRSEQSEAVSEGAGIRHVGPLQWHPGARCISEAGDEIPLTTTEYNILCCLLERPGEVVGKHDISKQALGKRLGPFDRALDVHIGRIRKKIELLSSGASRIKTVRGVGWLFIAE